MDKEINTTSGPQIKQGDFHQDVEVGPEMVDLDRIEKVYKYVTPSIQCHSMPTLLQEIRPPHIAR